MLDSSELATPPPPPSPSPPPPPPPSAGIERHDHSMAASIQFQVGDRCVFRLEEGGADTDGEITTLNSQPGLHSVYVYQHKET